MDRGRLCESQTVQESFPWPAQEPRPKGSDQETIEGGRITPSANPPYEVFAVADRDAYFAGTVSISLPANTGVECGAPSGEPPACSTVTA